MLGLFNKVKKGNGNADNGNKQSQQSQQVQQAQQVQQVQQAQAAEAEQGQQAQSPQQPQQVNAQGQEVQEGKEQQKKASKGGLLKNKFVLIGAGIVFGIGGFVMFRSYHSQPPPESLNLGSAPKTFNTANTAVSKRPAARPAVRPSARPAERGQLNPKAEKRKEAFSLNEKAVGFENEIGKAAGGQKSAAGSAEKKEKNPKKAGVAKEAGIAQKTSKPEVKTKAGELGKTKAEWGEGWQLAQSKEAAQIAAGIAASGSKKAGSVNWRKVETGEKTGEESSLPYLNGNPFAQFYIVKLKQEIAHYEQVLEQLKQQLNQYAAQLTQLQGKYAQIQQKISISLQKEIAKLQGKSEKGGKKQPSKAKKEFPKIEVKGLVCNANGSCVADTNFGTLKAGKKLPDGEVVKEITPEYILTDARLIPISQISQ
jgi:hypothetical protein